MRARVIVPGGLIILLACCAAERLEVSSTQVVTAQVDQSFHNQLHTFLSHPNITKHAKQMGYDYTSQNDAHTYGLRNIENLDAQYVWLRYRDDWYIPAQGISPTKMAEYDQNVCIRDPNATDPVFRYYIAWVNPWPSGGDGVALGFYTNYQSESVTTAAMNYFNAHLDWSKIDAGFVDEVHAEKGHWTVNAHYEYSSRQFFPFGSASVICANSGPQDYSFAAGFRRYRQAMLDLFHSRGLSAAANVWNTATSGQEIFANTTFDHYYNESAASQDAGSFGIVPANIVQLAPAFPVTNGNTNFSTVLGVAGLAAIQGSWFGTQGEDYQFIVTCSPTGGMCAPTPGMNAIQLLRAIPNWDNLVNATGRSWDGAVYRSSQSYADQAILYSRHPKTGKLFVVFRSGPAVLSLRPSETVVSVQCVDDLFIEREDCAGHFAVNGTEVRLTGSGQLNQGYIVELR